MTAIERTAYPRFSRQTQYRKEELAENYTLSESEISFVKKNAKMKRRRLNLAVQLKIVQHMGYFIEPEDIPGAIIRQIRLSLSLQGSMKSFYKHRSVRATHRNMVRDYLGMTKWTTQKPANNELSSQRFALQVAYETSHTMNHPADIINVVIETLVQKKIELPAFSALNRLVRHIRHIVNNNIFKAITEQLTENNILQQFDQLLVVSSDYNRSGYNALKQIPKAPTISNFRLLLQHHNWLVQFGDMSLFLNDIAKVKLIQFAAWAKSLDASDLKNMSDHVKYALIATLIHYAQQEIKDALATTFCRTVFKMHKDAGEKLKELREEHTKHAYNMAEFLISITDDVESYCQFPKELGKKIIAQYNEAGGTEKVTEQCQKVSAYNSKNHIPLLNLYYKSKRAALFDLINELDLRSSSQDSTLIYAMDILKDNQQKRSKQLVVNKPINLSFAPDVWDKYVFEKSEPHTVLNRRYFELCTFSRLANELRSGDVHVRGANSYGDYRTNLLPWAECTPMIDDFCTTVDLPSNAKTFVTELKQAFIAKTREIDNLFPDLSELLIDQEGKPSLKRKRKKQDNSSDAFINEIRSRMPERNIIDILCNTHHHTGWADLFGPISGQEPKLKDATEKYIINTFGNGTGMGPTETARHFTADISPHTLSWINRRHVNLQMLDAATVRLINYSNNFAIAKLLGDEKCCGVDGTFRDIYDDNLLSSTHVRYGKKGGIAYYHISDNYIALFSTFIPCGVWEAVEIIEGLIKNKSDIQPDIVHGDTQSQSAAVFALSYLFGIKLMPRIRNWKDLIFFRPEESTRYKHIDSMFGDNVIDWQLIETHWEDMMQVVLSIQEGKVSSANILRKLSNYSGKNRLYKSFRELGRVIRTMYLLDYIADPKLRETVTSCTNKVESYNAFSDWTRFASKYIVASNDAEEMEKAIKYNTLMNNAIIMQNFTDMSEIIYLMLQEGWKITKANIEKLSPYMTEHLKRFGNYQVNLKTIPPISVQIRDLELLKLKT